jgi:hypothetical protein
VRAVALLQSAYANDRLGAERRAFSGGHDRRIE